MNDDRVLRAFFAEDGTLHTIPSKRAKLLVENDFLTRESGTYWRSGGTVDV